MNRLRRFLQRLHSYWHATITIHPAEERGLKVGNHADRTYYGQAGFIETHSGIHFDPNNPAFSIGDISWALGMCVRYNGHCNRFYSVAEHCVLVSVLMEKETGGDPLEGLFHDAIEAYLTDVPAPFKQFLPDYKKFDDHLDGKLREWLNLGEKSPEAKRADWLALFIEAAVLMPSEGTIFSDPMNLRDYALQIAHKYPIHAFGPASATQQFNRRYEALKNVS